MSRPGRLTVPVTRGRARLFELSELVAQSPDTVVVFERRGAEPVALVREARLAYLEDRVRTLEALVAQPFELAGSLRSDLPDDAIERALEEIAGERERQSAKRLRRLAP
jgi:hypothetical protein